MSRESSLKFALLLVPFVFVALAGADPLQAQTGRLQGLVMDEAGQPVAGAQVYLPERDQGTLTDERGEFLILNVPPGTYSVRVQHISYEAATQQVAVEAGAAAAVEFTLGSSVIALDEVVVTGVGVVTEKRRLGQSVSSLGAEDIETAPVTSVQEVLSGRVPGLVANAIGETGASAPIRLRGTVSLSQGNEPLIYVDGVRVDNDRDEFASIVTSPLTHINPSNIERIEVLKGAAAATLYGTEASSGVIQIFTKRGIEGAPQWNFSTTQQFFRLPTSRLPQNAGYDEDTGEVMTNFPADDFVRTGHNQTYDLSVQGGTDEVRYFGSGWVRNEKGTLPTNSLRNAGARVGLDFFLTDKLTTQVNLNMINNSIRAPYPTWGLIGEFVIADPTIADELRPYGELFYTVEGALAYSNTTETNRRSLSAQADYEWTENLRSHFTLGYHAANRTNTIFIEFGRGLRDPRGRRERVHNTHGNTTLDFSTSWEAELGDALLSTFTVGGQSFWEHRRGETVEVTDYPAPGLRTLRGGSTVSEVDEFYEEVINAGLFAQEQIGIGDRLFVTAGLRIDGNSAFGEDFGFQPYPKLGLSWNVSDESFWNIDAINTFRLRSAYGTSGLQPGAYDALRTWRAVARVDNSPALEPQSVGNTALKPERSTELELGADLGLFDSRLGLEVTYFRQQTTDAILERYLPPSSGFLEAQFVNIGRVESQGVEAAVDLSLYQSENLAWRLNGTMSALDQVVADLGGVTPFKASTDTRRWNWIREGYSPGAVIAPVLDESDPYGLSVDIEDFDDLTQVIPNKLKRASGEDSLVFIGHQAPTLTGSISTTLDLPQRSLSFRMMWRAEGGFVMFDESNLIRAQSGLTTEAARWTQELKDPNTSAERRQEIAAAWAAQHPDVHSTWVEDADYIRLQELGVTWTAPEGLVRPLGLGTTSITLSGRNLLLFTKYGGTMDPGTSSTSANDFAQNVDYYGAPLSPRFGFTVRTNF